MPHHPHTIFFLEKERIFFLHHFIPSILCLSGPLPSTPRAPAGETVLLSFCSLLNTANAVESRAAVSLLPLLNFIISSSLRQCFTPLVWCGSVIIGMCRGEKENRGRVQTHVKSQSEEVEEKSTQTQRGRGKKLRKRKEVLSGEDREDRGGRWMQTSSRWNQRSHIVTKINSASASGACICT